MDVLLVEDDRKLARALTALLEEDETGVTISHDGEEGLRLGTENKYDAIILDIMLPNMNGFDVCKSLRDQRVKTPVLMLTARTAVDDRVNGLDAGADDYLAKPFDLTELEARLKALTRRFGRDGQLRCGLIRYDPASAMCYRNELPLELSPRESLLLRALLARVDRVVPKEALMAAVFGGDDGVKPDALDVLLHRLRKKLQAIDSALQIVNTRGHGYALRQTLAA